MTRFAKLYQAHKKKKEQQNKILNRVGCGYIKRRLGLLSNEVELATNNGA